MPALASMSSITLIAPRAVPPLAPQMLPAGHAPSPAPRPALAGSPSALPLVPVIFSRSADLSAATFLTVAAAGGDGTGSAVGTADAATASDFETAGPIGGGGSTDPQPGVTITSPGHHAGDPGLPPQYVQGQKYTVQWSYATIPQDPEGPTVSWVPLKDVWTYPAAAVKGYGTFATRNDDPDGPYDVFLDPPTDAANTTVDVEFFDANNPSVADDLDNLHQSTDHFIDSFYFGPRNVGDVTISVVTTFAKYVNGVDSGTRLLVADSVTVNVVKPEGVMEILQVGTAGISPVQAQGKTFLQFDKDRPRPFADNVDGVTAPNPGVKWRSHVDEPLRRDGTSFGGLFFNTQNLYSIRSRSYSTWTSTYTQERFRLRSDKSHPGVCLDNSVGQPGHTSETRDGEFLEDNGQVHEAADVGLWMTMADAPGEQLFSTMTDDDGTRHDTNDYSINDRFLTTLMYQPTGGIPVPVYSFDWKWGGQAKLVNGQWQPGDNVEPEQPDSKPYQSVDAPVPTTAFPIWGHNVNEFMNQWVSMY